MKLIVLLALIWLLPSSVLAQETRFSESFDGVRPPIEVTLQRLPRESGWQARLLVGSSAQEAASAQFPEWAGAPYYDYDVELRSLGGVSVLLFEAIPATGRDAPGSASSFQALFAQRGRSWTLVTQTRYSLLDGGIRLEWSDNGELIRRTQDAGAFCAAPSLNAGYQRFIPTSLTFSSAVDTDLIESNATTEANTLVPDAPFELEPYNYSLWYAASSNQRNPDDSVTAIRPTEVGDLNGSTAWISGRPGENRGQFITARLNPALKLKGLRIFPGHGASESEFRKHMRPKKLLISTDSGGFIANLPEVDYDTLTNLGGVQIRLPESVRSRCLSLLVLETYPALDRSDPSSSRTIAIAEATPMTELHGIPADVAALVVVEMLLKQDDPGNTRRLAQLTSPIGPELAKVLDSVISSGNAEDIALVAPLLRYLPAEEAVPILFALFRTLPADHSAYPQVKRSMVANAEMSRNYLSSLPPSELGPEKRIDLIRMIGRVGTVVDIRNLIENLGEDDKQLRQERIRAVVRGGEEVLPELFRFIATSKDAEARNDAFQATYSIARKKYYAAPSHVPGSEVLTQELNRSETSPRQRMLILTTLKHIAPSGGLDTLIQVLKSAQNPLERREAASSLGHYSQREARVALEEALRDPSPDVRIEAIVSLSKREDLSFSQAAILDFVDQDRWPEAQTAAFAALATIGSATAMSVLEEELLDEPASASATRAADAIRRADRPINVSVASSVISAPAVPFLTKRHIVDALGTTPGNESFGALTRVVDAKFEELDEKRQDNLRTRAILSIGRHGTPQARKFLFELLEDKDHQLSALRALAFFQDPALIDELREFQRINPALETEIQDTITMIERRLDVEGIKSAFEDAEEFLSE